MHIVVPHKASRAVAIKKVKEQIDELHFKYKEALLKLHEQYRHTGHEEELKILY